MPRHGAVGVAAQAFATDMLQRLRDFVGTWILLELWRGLFLT